MIAIHPHARGAKWGGGHDLPGEVPKEGTVMKLVWEAAYSFVANLNIGAPGLLCRALLH